VTVVEGAAGAVVVVVGLRGWDATPCPASNVKA
jgi:hypothetical protein